MEEAETSSVPCHLLPYHCLDVAAVGYELLTTCSKLFDGFCEISGLPPHPLRSWITYFLALHDLGKFSEGFQKQRPDILQKLQGKEGKRPYDLRHDSLGFIIWEGRISNLLLNDRNVWKIQAEFRCLKRWRLFFTHWFYTATGHHGQPPKVTDRPVSRYFSHEDVTTCEEFALDCASWMLPSQTFHMPFDASEGLKRIKRLSWWLAGLGVLCDWLGSNQKFFPYIDAPMPLEEYWRNFALPQARIAIKNSGILPAKPASQRKIHELFEYIDRPTHLQELVSKIELSDSPQLFILEDVTGAGKTEAAFILANRILAKGLSQGLYVALPTMATANAMYLRTKSVYRQFFSQNSNPSLVLAHSARHLVDDFSSSILPEPALKDSEYFQGESTASAHCAAWIADNRKKALLAHVGVGTIDQALLSILHSKHQSLRLLGLWKKVLIVDEVHACDAYLHGLLKRLLMFHAAGGGSAILLSATLPLKMRQELIQAFANGLEINHPEIKEKSYPLLTSFSPAKFLEVPVKTREEVRRTLKVELIYSQDEVFKLLKTWTEVGKAVCWVRNTVSDAIEAFNTLKSSFGLSDGSLILFHSRFTLGDRLDIEQKVLDTFGKDSSQKTRAGKLLIATQVVEQSLDLDFDYMISDLAPIDLLIQRAGRLRRHTRDKFGNKIEGNDQRGMPTLFVYGPQPVDNPHSSWYSDFFPLAQKVYPRHGELWLTADFLKKKKEIRIPEDARNMMEAVFEDKALNDMPKSFITTQIEADGEDSAKASLADLNAISLDKGYEPMALDWWSDAITPTTWIPVLL